MKLASAGCGCGSAGRVVSPWVHPSVRETRLIVHACNLRRWDQIPPKTKVTQAATKGMACRRGSRDVVMGGKGHDGAAPSVN